MAANTQQHQQQQTILLPTARHTHCRMQRHVGGTNLLTASASPRSCRSHYISAQQFGANVQRIIDAGKKAGISKFLIITPPPVCEACKGKTPVSGEAVSSLRTIS
jgi:hypothetical protein